MRVCRRFNTRQDNRVKIGGYGISADNIMHPARGNAPWHANTAYILGMRYGNYYGAASAMEKVG
jgi:hypothetical protein